MAELATICLCESRYPTAISEGSKEICRARVTYRTKINGVRKFLHAEGKLDTGGSVSLSHEEHLMDIKDCREYGMPRVKLSGIGGASPYLDKGGILQIQAPDGSLVKVKMYVFNTAIGNTPKMLLFSLLSLREANMDILHHIDMSLNGKMAPLRFLGENSPSRYKRKRSKGPLGYNKLTKTELFLILKEKVDNGKTAPRHYVKASKAFKRHMKEAQETERLKLEHDNAIGLGLFCVGDIAGHHVLQTDFTRQDEDMHRITDFSTSQGHSEHFPVLDKRRPTALVPLLAINAARGVGEDEEWIHPFDHAPKELALHEHFMTEIQLRRISDRNASSNSEAVTDGDETMVKDGKVISKFSKESIHLGDAVLKNDTLIARIHAIYDKYVGQDGVYPLKNGAPKIMTKFKDKPYSYELLDEYKRGDKKFPCVKAMEWHGKPATAAVIRNFAKATPVVEPCDNPRCISRLVIVPKFAPGQSKEDPDHGFRVCVNALVNKCLKADASTIPLAIDEIKKLSNKKYFLQADGANAYWSIPVCEESKRLTAFHTPDGIYCWNRLLMGAKPSSAVQQSAYLEALDQYIDFKEDGTLRDCLLNADGTRIVDAEGIPKTLRKHFAVYCDDICAGADTLEELYDLYEALIHCCSKAGIQVKASKVKFGVEKVTFHNYTITRDGTEPKEANMCPIRNMKDLKDVHQVKAFLGCCQQMAQYVQEYGIIASPLHMLTKAAVKFPTPWVKGSAYDIAFHRLRTAMLDGTRFLHHQQTNKRLFIEVDASDFGWGACLYQAKDDWQGNPEDEGESRNGKTTERNVIYWISKAWTAHELQLPVFYRESLARLLALEKFRNQIEANITAGITLYTDHKPGLYEGSLSNKGQLSAWKLVENSDLLSIVQNLYTPGSKMICSDPLSRICSPAQGFFDVNLPRKLTTLFKYLPQKVKDCVAFRAYFNKDTAAGSRLIQKWRSGTNPISQGKMNTWSVPQSARASASEKALPAFVIGTPFANTGVLEIRKLLEKNQPFAVLCSISLLPEIARDLTGDEKGHPKYNDDIAQKVTALTKIILTPSAEAWLIHIPGQETVHEVLAFDKANLLYGCTHDAAMDIMQTSKDSFMTETTASPEWNDDDETWNMQYSHFVGTRGMASEKDVSSRATRAQCRQMIDENRPLVTKQKAAKSKARAPAMSKSLSQQKPLSSWIGRQWDQVPDDIKDNIKETMEGFPEGLIAVTEKDESPRIVVPKDEVDRLIMNAHYDIHHQGHVKVFHILRPLFYWPNMSARIKDIVTACETCVKAIQRRKHIKSVFDSKGPASVLLPRQAYGMDFYGTSHGEILVIVDLATRETILRFLPNQKQEHVARTLLNSVFYTRGVPLVIRSDNAPQLMQGAARDMCKYLGIEQVVTGGHNPRGNAICERVNQTIGSMIRKMNDHDYKNLKNLLPAFEFAINCSFNSAIGCTPFEAGHGLPARTITEARLSPKGVRGNDPDSLEDVNQVFDESLIKLQVELSTRIMEDARATSEWYRRMTCNNLNQSGQEIDLNKMKIGTQVYFYKPPSVDDVKRLGRKAKHINHYVGPGTIKEQIGSRGFMIEFTNPRTKTTHEFQRDAGMILLKKPDPESGDPANVVRASKAPSKHTRGSIPEEGEFIITNCESKSKTWYVAQVTEVLADRIKVNYYTTQAPALENYKTAEPQERLNRLADTSFLRTWCLDRGLGKATNKAPKNSLRRAKDLWRGQLPLKELDDIILVRNVGLSGTGVLDAKTSILASKLRIPHHEGAGGEDDFVDKPTFERHVRKSQLHEKRRKSQRSSQKV